MNYENYTQCGKNLAKAFNLKVYKQNFHEIEKISIKPHVYEPINEKIGTLKITKL